MVDTASCNISGVYGRATIQGFYKKDYGQFCLHALGLLVDFGITVL